MPVYSIRKARFEELDLCASVIRRSFVTVAKEFGLTLQNCPGNGAFIQVERLIGDWNQGAGLYGLYCDQELTGFMELKRKDSKGFELEKLCVLPQHRHFRSLSMNHPRLKGGSKKNVPLLHALLQVNPPFSSKSGNNDSDGNVPSISFISSSYLPAREADGIQPCCPEQS